MISASALLAKTRNNSTARLLARYPANDGNHRGNARAAGHKPHLLRHAVHPMAAWIRAAHQHAVSDLPVMEILRNRASFVPLDRQVEIPRGAGHRRWRVGPFRRFSVDRRVDVQMIAGQHVQRGVVRQVKAERLRVVGIAMNGCEFVGHRRLRLDARDRSRSHHFIIRA